MVQRVGDAERVSLQCKLVAMPRVDVAAQGALQYLRYHKYIKWEATLRRYQTEQNMTVRQILKNIPEYPNLSFFQLKL